MIWDQLWTDSDRAIRKQGAFVPVAVISGAIAVAYTLMVAHVGYISVDGARVPTLR